MLFEIDNYATDSCYRVNIWPPQLPPRSNLHLVLYSAAGILLIWMVSSLIRLLDSSFFIKSFGNRIYEYLMCLKDISRVVDIIDFRMRYLHQLDRFYDAARSAINNFDRYTLQNIIAEFIQLSMKIERNWTEIMGNIGQKNNGDSTALIKLIKKEAEQMVHEGSRFINSNVTMLPKAQSVVELIWEPIYRVHNTGETMIEFTKYRADFRYMPEVLIKDALDQWLFLTPRALCNIYAKVL